jgi:co-chaperonin GroES (HSP10)
MAWKGKCLGSNVVLEPIENVQISEGGLNFTSVSDQTQKWGKGKVLSVGESVPLDSEGMPCIKEGDIVLYDKNKSSDFMEDTVSYKAMLYGDIFKVF